MRTNQGILVVVPGSDYKPYCNTCGWKGVLVRSLGDAQLACRAHVDKCGKK